MRYILLFLLLVPVLVLADPVSIITAIGASLTTTVAGVTANTVLGAFLISNAGIIGGLAVLALGTLFKPVVS